MRARHFFPTIMICQIGILLLMSCGGQPQNPRSDAVGYKNDDAFHQALCEQASDINEVNQKAEQQRAEIEREQQRADIESRKRLEQRTAEERNNMLESKILEVLQGAWEWSKDWKGSVIELYIEGDYITCLSDGLEEVNGKIREIDLDNMIIFFGRDNYLSFRIYHDSDFRLYADRERCKELHKLSEKTLKYRSEYNKHLKWWDDAYNAYRKNVFPNSTIQNIKDMRRAIDCLKNDVHHGGNIKMKEHVRKLEKITNGLQPY